MSVAAEIAYHAAREMACRANAANAEAPGSAQRHLALADLHAARAMELEREPDIYSLAELEPRLPDAIGCAALCGG